MADNRPIEAAHRILADRSEDLSIGVTPESLLVAQALLDYVDLCDQLAAALEIVEDGNCCVWGCKDEADVAMAAYREARKSEP